MPSASLMDHLGLEQAANSKSGARWRRNSTSSRSDQTGGVLLFEPNRSPIQRTST